MSKNIGRTSWLPHETSARKPTPEEAAYAPWEIEGITEAAYWKCQYLKARKLTLEPYQPSAVRELVEAVMVLQLAAKGNFGTETCQKMIAQKHERLFAVLVKVMEGES